VRRAIKSESIPDLASALVFGGAGATVAAATIRKPQTTFRRAAEGIRATGRGFASAAAAVTGMGGQTTGRAAEAVAGTAAALGGTAAAATGGAKVLAGLVGTFAKLKESITAFMQSSLGQIITKIAIAGAAIAGVVLAFKGLVAISNTFKRTLGSIERGAVGAASRQQELADSSLLIAGAFRRFQFRERIGERRFGAATVGSTDKMLESLSRFREAQRREAIFWTNWRNRMHENLLEIGTALFNIWSIVKGAVAKFLIQTPVIWPLLMLSKMLDFLGMIAKVLNNTYDWLTGAKGGGGNPWVDVFNESVKDFAENRPKVPIPTPSTS
jgi:hypothetical protein